MPLVEDISSWKRIDRQLLYARVLKEHSSEHCKYTPKMIRKHLEANLGKTFAFVGQDMAAMRITWAKVVGVEGRGYYWWRDAAVPAEILPECVNKRRK